MLYRASWFDAGVLAARLLGLNGARGLARTVAEFYRLTHPQAQATVRQNLALLCGPQLAGPAVRRTFRNFGATMADYFQLGARTKQDALALIDSRRGFEHIQTALAGGKGVLVVTVHTGLFELGGLLLEEFQLPLVVLSLPEPDPALNEWRAAYRRQWGAETLEVGSGEFSFVAITRELAQGKCVAMLVDRPHRGDDAILVDFPHGRVPFSTGPAWLSLLSGAPLVPTTIVASANGKYTVEAQSPLYLESPGQDHAATVRQLTLEIADRFRETICRHPDQWYQFAPLSQPYSSPAA